MISPSLMGIVEAESEIQKSDKFADKAVLVIARKIGAKSHKDPAGEDLFDGVQEQSKILFAPEIGQVVYLKNTGKFQIGNIPIPNEDDSEVTLDLNISYTTEISLLPEPEE